jgi:hypothetical protein
MGAGETYGGVGSDVDSGEKISAMTEIGFSALGNGIAYQLT